MAFSEGVQKPRIGPPDVQNAARAAETNATNVRYVIFVLLVMYEKLYMYSRWSGGGKGAMPRPALYK